MIHKCPTCRAENEIVNQCGCDKSNLPTPVTPEQVEFAKHKDHIILALRAVYGISVDYEIVSEDRFSDPCIALDGANLCLQETEAKKLQWYWGVEVCVPGVRYYPDGSGQPDDYDFDEKGGSENLDEAIQEFIKLVAEIRLNGYLTYVAESKMEEEWRNE
jgi:hypothetical protein